MKKIIVVLVSLLFTFSSVAYADTYTVDEILPSISSFSDEELDELAAAISTEQELRVASNIEEPQTEKIENVSFENVDVTQNDDYIERPTIQRGNNGEDVKSLQERLIELGFLNGAADGDFGQKSEGAVLLFQKANGLEETGIADSITQYIIYSPMAVNKEAFDNRPIMTGEGWEIIKEFYHNSSRYYYYDFVLKNTSGYNAKIKIDATFYDADGKIVGVASNSEYACENNYETFWSFNNDIEFDHVSLTISLSEEKNYRDGGQSCVEITSDIVGNKVIISATNNANKPVRFIEYHVVFLNENGEFVDSGWGYLTDDDSELKPSATEMRDESTRNNFSDVLVYAHGRIDK